MTRTCAREIAVRLCFGLSVNERAAEDILAEFFESEYYATFAEEDEAFEEYPDDAQLAYIHNVVSGVSAHNAELDTYIEQYAKGWSFSRISRTAVTVMKTAMYEILYMPDIPSGAAINEAINLAKKYEEPETVPFINGVLGSFVRGEAGQS